MQPSTSFTSITSLSPLCVYSNTVVIGAGAEILKIQNNKYTKDLAQKLYSEQYFEQIVHKSSVLVTVRVSGVRSGFARFSRYHPQKLRNCLGKK